MYTINNLPNENKSSNLNRDYFELTEKDFYPPEDTRYYQSGVYDICGGDNFADYASYFFDLYEEELFDN